MTPELTTEMHDALAANPDQPLLVVDGQTQQPYVLIPAATFERVRPLIYDADEPDAREFLPLAHEALAAEWDAPGMELYDDYDAHRPKP